MPDLFADPDGHYRPSLADEIEEVRRELRLRYRHYPRWVTAGKMTEAEAKRHIATLDAVLTRLEAIEREQRARAVSRLHRAAERSAEA